MKILLDIFLILMGISAVGHTYDSLRYWMAYHAIKLKQMNLETTAAESLIGGSSHNNPAKQVSNQLKDSIAASQSHPEIQEIGAEDSIFAIRFSEDIPTESTFFGVKFAGSEYPPEMEEEDENKAV